MTATVTGRVGNSLRPLAALGVRLRELGAEAVVCAPPDCAERLAEVGVPLVVAGAPQVVVPRWGDQPYFAGRVAGTIGTDGAMVAAELLLDGGAGRGRNPVR